MYKKTWEPRPAEAAVFNVCNFLLLGNGHDPFSVVRSIQRTARSNDDQTMILLLQKIRHFSLWLSFCWLEVVG